MNKVAIYILTKDRYDYAIQCIDSALLNNKVDVIVSDCSNNDSLYSYIKNISINNSNSISYLYREKHLEQFNHIKTILSENKHEFFTLFHDDDLLHINYVDIMLNKHENGDYVAVNCDYNLIDYKQNLLKKNSFYKFSNDVGKKVLLDSYCKIGFRRHPCFSGYMYSMKIIGDLYPNVEEGGTWSDLAFILNIADRGKIAWVNETLMSYRIHPSNISKVERIKDRILITNFIKKKYDLGKYSDYIINYKLKYLSKFLNRKRVYRVYIKLLTLAIIKRPLIICKLFYIFFMKFLKSTN